VSDERELAKQRRQFLDAFCDSARRGSVALINMQENIVELRERGLGPANWASSGQVETRSSKISSPCLVMPID
jgi:hypothetical protein